MFVVTNLKQYKSVLKDCGEFSLAPGATKKIIIHEDQTVYVTSINVTFDGTEDEVYLIANPASTLKIVDGGTTPWGSGAIIKDAFLFGGSPNNNFGASTVLSVGAGTDRRYIIGFPNITDLVNSGVWPDFAQGVARLDFGAGMEFTTKKMLCYQVLRDWNEGNKANAAADADEVTWNSAKHGSVAWTTAGCGGAGTDYDSTIEMSTYRPHKSSGWYQQSIEIPWTVLSNLKTATTVFGLIIKPETGYGADGYIYSTDQTYGHFPILRLARPTPTSRVTNKKYTIIQAKGASMLRNINFDSPMLLPVDITNSETLINSLILTFVNNSSETKKINFSVNMVG